MSEPDHWIVLTIYTIVLFAWLGWLWSSTTRSLDEDARRRELTQLRDDLHRLERTTMDRIRRLET